ncbi:MAG: sigma-70 family RNA polymerase sigma factor [Solirubrobacteraceae bacterium]
MSRASVLIGSATSTPVDDDSSLVARARGGDDRAFEVLFARYRPRITSYVHGMVGDHGRAEDITQEVFISALRRMRATERPIAFRPWLYEIAKNASIDQHRRSRRAEELSFDADGGLGAADRGRLVAADPTPDEQLAVKQRLNDLCGAFGDLSDNQHQILVLRELEGMSYREIGDRMGMSRPAVESTLFRARRRLTEEYDELVTGRRCLRVQSAISSAAEGGDAITARDRRRLSRHLSYCQPCRRHARRAGVEVDVAARPSVAARLGALLPIPFLLRPRRSPDDVAVAASSSQGAGSAANWSAALTFSAEPLGSGLAKIAAAAATLALATVGPGVGGDGKSPLVAHGAQDLARPAATIQTTRNGGDEALRPDEGTLLGLFAPPGGDPAIGRVTLPARSNSGSGAGRDRGRAGARDDERRARGHRQGTPAPPGAGRGSAEPGQGAGPRANADPGAPKDGDRPLGVELPGVPTPEAVREVGAVIDGAVKQATDPLTGASVPPTEVTTPAVGPVPSTTTRVPAVPDVGG